MSAPKLSSLIRRNGQSLVRKAVDAIIVQDKADGQQRISLPRKIAGFALTKLATRSVPGAILVGGVLLAKHLHDRKQERKKGEDEGGE